MRHLGTKELESPLERQARRESAARSYPRKLPIALASGAGTIVRDTAGREYIDCLTGAGTLALGHHHPVVVAALEDALAARVPLTTLDLTTPLKDAFVEELFGALPPHLADGRVLFCGPTGADAVEAAVKLAKSATGRTGVLAFGGAYHGMTQGALALSGGHAAKRGLGPLLADVRHLPFPTSYRCPFGIGGERGAELCAAAVEWALTDEQSGMPAPAAIVLEPVQGEGGVRPAPPAFARAVAGHAAATGTVLIADEVQTGLGRTGALWASDPLGIEPDVLVLSKAIGGGLPLAVIVFRPELDVWEAGAHAGTFRGNQLAMAAGAATIRHVVAEGLAERAEALGERFRAQLRDLLEGIEAVADVRGRGLMVGVELVQPGTVGPGGRPRPARELAAAVQRELLELGVIVERGGLDDAMIRFLPPLIVDADQLERVACALRDALATVLASR
jgi:diaminobutyrate-2-oxoglutarate transaminase